MAMQTQTRPKIILSLPSDTNVSKKRSKDEKEELFGYAKNAYSVNDLESLIYLSESNEIFTNIDVEMLWRITPYLKELNNMVGMKSLKKSVFEQILYFLQHLHKTDPTKKLISEMDEAKEFKKGTKKIVKKTKYVKEDTNISHIKYTQKHPITQTTLNNAVPATPFIKDPNNMTINDYLLSVSKLNQGPLITGFSGAFNNFQQPMVCQPLCQDSGCNSSSSTEIDSKSQGDYLNMIITGPPGCGKTRVATIIAKMYREMKLFKSSERSATIAMVNGVLTEVPPEPIPPIKIAHRDDFIAGYIGQTAIKTRTFLNKHKGGVIFLDEAYSLGHSNENNKDTFTTEAIDTLVSFLSENKDDVCFIMAGYEKEIEDRFLNSNDGLCRRFPWVHKIESYSPSELVDIFLQNCKEIEWSVNIDKKELVNLFTKHHSIFTNSGGDMEILLTRSKIINSIRTFSGEISKRRKIELQDVVVAVDELYKIKEKDNKKQDKFSHSMMYS